MMAFTDTWVNVYVGHYYSFEVECKNDHQDCGPGKIADFGLKIRNKGNDMDTAQVNISEGATGIESKGFKVALTQTDFILCEGCDSIFNLTVSVPKDYVGNETFAIKLHIVSTQAISMGETEYPDIEYTLYLHVYGKK